MTELVTVYLSLGSNLGNRQENLDTALKLLSQRMQVGKISSIYDTEADRQHRPAALSEPGLRGLYPPDAGRPAGDGQRPRAEDGAA